ncbi:MAG: hypothetical protein WAK82_25005 [Streptosporangiaceae bacterium]
MNDHGKPRDDPAQQNERAHELIEQLNLLEAVDRRVTPEHVAQRFRELLGNADPSVLADVNQRVRRESGIRRVGLERRRLSGVLRRILILGAGKAPNRHLYWRPQGTWLAFGGILAGVSAAVAWIATARSSMSVLIFFVSSSSARCSAFSQAERRASVTSVGR